MKKISVIFLFLSISLQNFAQSSKIDGLKAQFFPSQCECLESNKSLSNNVILNEKMDTCINKFLDEKGLLFKDSTERDEFETQIIEYFTTNIEQIVRVCPFYQEVIKSQIKEQIFSTKEELTKEKIEETLLKFQAYEEQAKDNEQKNYIFMILGAIHYCNNDFPKALSYFEKAYKIQANPTVKIYMELVKISQK